MSKASTWGRAQAHASSTSDRFFLSLTEKITDASHVHPEHLSYREVMELFMSAASFAKDLISAAGKAGAYLTRQAREKTLERFARWAYAKGYQLHTVSQIKDKHIGRYIEQRLTDQIDKRTLQNEMSAIRIALRGAGRERYADGETISNKSLGIDKASRIGTKAEMPAERFADEFLPLATAKDEGVGICLELQRELGLREKEALMSVQSLKAWKEQLQRSTGEIHIVHGTKGGRARIALPLDRERALTMVNRAQAIAEKNGGRLVNKPDLKSALARYSRVCYDSGMKGVCASHSLRYGYACDFLRRFHSMNVPEKEARAIVSGFLGHGDGRGRWVAMVYGRTVDK